MGEGLKRARAAARATRKTPKLRWLHDYPYCARFDWNKSRMLTGRWLYALRAGVAVAIFYNGPDRLTEIDVSPHEVGPYVWQGRCKSLAAAKAKAVQLVQASLNRMAKAWSEVRT